MESKIAYLLKNNNTMRLKKQIADCENKLSNSAFLSKAPKSVVNVTKKKLKDFELQLKMNIDEIINNLKKECDENFFDYFIQEIRIFKYSEEFFTEDFYNRIYFDKILDEEIEDLYILISNNIIADLFKYNSEKF